MNDAPELFNIVKQWETELKRVKKRQKKGTMMSELKCPFCQQELKELYDNGISVGFRCKNKNCPETNIMCGTKGLWQELIRTRKALDVAVDALKRIAGTNKECDIGWKMIEMKNNAHDTLNQIKTALEQKDIK